MIFFLFGEFDFVRLPNSIELIPPIEFDWVRFTMPGLDDLDRLDRVEFYRDDHVNFKAIIWKRSQTIGTIEGYPRSHHFFPVIENKFGPDGAEAEKII